MKLIRAALGDHLDLCAREPPILRIITIGNHFHRLHGVFARCDHRRPTPYRANGADSIDVDAVGFVLPAGVLNLRTIFSGEYPTRSAGRATRSLIAGKIESPATRLLRGVAKRTRRKLRE